MSKPFKIAVLISGGGTTLKNLMDVQVSGQFAGEIVHVISSNANAAGNGYATENNIPLSVVERSTSDDIEEFSESIFGHCRNANVNLVVMGGFLKRILIPVDFENRVINIHPSLIPAFSGHGYYGIRVHEAVIEYGCRVSGCTVHFVDNEYDHGPIIAQRAVNVVQGDTANRLAKRVFEVECLLYPEVINWIVEGRVAVKNRAVSIANN